MTSPYYTDDHVTIYHGDCMDLLPDTFGYDLVVTSPPYNLAGANRYGFPLWFFDQAPMVLPWWATHDKRFKLWPAWPCQSCMGRLEGIPNSTGGES